VLNAWQSDDSERVNLGKQWFIDRKNGADQNWHSFTSGQKRGALPEGFDKSKINIGIFNNSLNEYELIPGWGHDIFTSDYAVLEKILDEFKNDGSIHFYVRMHPSITNEHNTQVTIMKKICDRGYSNFTVIWPSEKIDTYSLLLSCDKVLTFGSTVGVEACFWGVPSILAGRAMYEDLDCTYLAKNYEHLFELLRSSLSPKDSLEAIKVGYSRATHGIKFKRYQPVGFYHGYFNGKRLTPKYHWKTMVLKMV